MAGSTYARENLGSRAVRGLLEHHYDEKGRLRFAFGRTGAVNDTVVEHRLWYPFPTDGPEKYVVRDAANELSVQPDCRN